MQNVSIELVTAHTGQPHITVQNVIDLINGMTGYEDNIVVLNGLGVKYANDVVTIHTGYGIAGGYYFTVNEPVNFDVTPHNDDKIYVVIYGDPETNIQTCEFVYVGKDESLPGGANVLKTLEYKEVMKFSAGPIPFMFLDSEDVFQCRTHKYLVEHVSSIERDLSGIQKSFTAGYNNLINALNVIPEKQGAYCTPTEIANALKQEYESSLNSYDIDYTMGVELGRVNVWKITLSTNLGSWSLEVPLSGNVSSQYTREGVLNFNQKTLNNPPKREDYQSGAAFLGDYLVWLGYSQNDLKSNDGNQSKWDLAKITNALNQTSPGQKAAQLFPIREVYVSGDATIMGNDSQTISVMVTLEFFGGPYRSKFNTKILRGAFAKTKTAVDSDHLTITYS